MSVLLTFKNFANHQNQYDYVQAKTKDPQLSDKQQALKKMTAQAFKPKGGSKNYLHIGIDAAELQIGDQMKVNLNLGKSPGVKNQDFTYMVRNTQKKCVCVLVV